MPHTKYYDQLHHHWVKRTQADREIGGARFQQSVKLARKALAHFGTPELKDVLERSRLGSHPEMVRLFWRVGQMMDKSQRPASPPPRRKTVAEILYPNMKP